LLKAFIQRILFVSLYWRLVLKQARIKTSKELSFWAKGFVLKTFFAKTGLSKQLYGMDLGSTHKKTLT
jgi:hypothetical protein